MDAIASLVTDLSADPAADALRARLRRLMLPGETPLADLSIRSPRDGAYLVTTQRVLFIINEQIGYRMGCVPNEEVTGVRHIRQRSTNLVHIVHTSGKLLLTSANDRAVRLFVSAVRRAGRKQLAAESAG